MSLKEKIKEVIENKRGFSALTGVPPEKFNEILYFFEAQLNKPKINPAAKITIRKRRPGGGAPAYLPSPEEKLFFILYYLKNYDSYDTLAFIFRMSSSAAYDNVKQIFPVLLNTLKAMNVLPYRDFKSLKKFRYATEKYRKIIFDATERPIVRHTNNARQKLYYSGKKKLHTVKNLSGVESGGGVLYVGKTAPGRVHDYTLLKRGFDNGADWFKDREIYVDLGFQGIRKDYGSVENIFIPFKKPRKSKNNPNPSLTPKQKKYNRALARERIVIEHVFGKMKIFRILTDRIRNRSNKFIDDVFLAVAGLYNLKKSFIVQ